MVFWGILNFLSLFRISCACFASSNIDSLFSRHEAGEEPNCDSSAAEGLPRPQTWQPASLLQGAFPQSHGAPPHPGVTSGLMSLSPECVAALRVLKTTEQIAVIILSHCHINDSRNKASEEKNLDPHNILTPVIYLSQLLKPIARNI